MQAQAQKLTRSMFPDAQSDSFPMHRCMRILPHHDDTGGFFIAVLEKVGKYPEAGGVKRPRREDAEATGAPSAADVAATDAAVDAASQADQASMAAVAAAKAASDRADVMLQSVSHLKLLLTLNACS